MSETRIIVACVWVRGHVPFGLEYVTRLQKMVARHVRQPYEMVCLTDRPGALPDGVRPILIKPKCYLKGWWSKVELFNPAHDLKGRVLYLDLDCLVVASLSRIIDFPARMAMIPDGGNFRPKGYRVVRRFNSSVMVFEAGVCRELFTDWKPAIASDLWGDQDWIGERAPDLQTMPAEWFPRFSECNGPPWPTRAAVILCKKPKNHHAIDVYPWFDKEWGG